MISQSRSPAKEVTVLVTRGPFEIFRNRKPLTPSENLSYLYCKICNVKLLEMIASKVATKD